MLWAEEVMEEEEEEEDDKQRKVRNGTITYGRAKSYEPPAITDDDVRNERKVQIGDHFNDLEDIIPKISTFDKKRIKSISGRFKKVIFRTIEEAQLHPKVLQNLNPFGITKLTYVQKYAIPYIYNGTDVIVSSPTGTGKTASYLLPVLSNFLKVKAKNCHRSLPYALILAPTHELARQILIDAMGFVTNSGKKIQIVYGGANTKTQVNKIQNEGCDILIGTPGRVQRILEHSETSLSHCRYVVLDEVDRLMENDFPDVVYEIMYRYYKMCKNDRRQTLMFSATFLPKNLELLFEIFLCDSNYASIIFDVMSSANKHVNQIIEDVSRIERFNRLVELLREDLELHDCNEDFYANKTLVFVNKKQDIGGNRKKNIIAMQERLCNEGIPNWKMNILHGDLDQEIREKTLKDFTNGVFPILIASTVASHGLDIVEVDHVINFDLPRSIADYVQRIGRTGRIGNTGKATTFIDPLNADDKKFAPQLIKTLANAQQVVPKFLEDMCSRIGSSGQTESLWNGMDVAYFTDRARELRHELNTRTQAGEQNLEINYRLLRIEKMKKKKKNQY